MFWYVSEFNQQAVSTLAEYDMFKAPSSVLICGPAGTGKTEMLRRCYQRLKKKSGVLYLDAAAFQSGFAYAAQVGGLSEFRKKTRKSRLLVFDHLEKLKGKPLSIEEFLHVYDDLIEDNAKLILAFQGDVADLSFLGDKLVSRLLGGLVLPIQVPSSSEMLAYLERYASTRFLITEAGVLPKLAQRVHNFPEAQNMLNAFVRYADTSGSALDQQALAAFGVFMEAHNHRLATPDNIVAKTAELTGIPTTEILGSRKGAEIVRARRLAIYAIRVLCHSSYPDIGKYFNRVHSAVMKAYQQFEETLKIDRDWEERCNRLLTFFQKGV